MLALFSNPDNKKSTVRLITIGLFMLAMMATSLFMQPAASAGKVIWSPSSTMEDVAIGSKATCAVAGGKAYCWGTNTYGNLGNTSIAVDADSFYPIPVDTSGALSGKTVTNISAGGLYYFCVLADGKPYCWGRNSYNMFGTGSATNSLVPVATDTTGVLAGKTITAITTGDGHACAIADSRAYCWGTNGQGRVGDNTTSSRSTPVAVYTGGALGSKTVTSISAESGSSCVVADGKVYCWGSNNYGQLGNGTYTDSKEAVLVGVGSVMDTETLVKVTNSNGGSCALSDTGKVFCWGWNSNGELGNNTTTNSNVPVRAIGSLVGVTAVDLSVGQFRPCALDSVSQPHCWGNGILGDGIASASSVPVSVVTSGVLDGITLARVAAGKERVSCAQSTNVNYCWGSSGRMIGTGVTSASLAPDYTRSIEPMGTSAYRFYRNADSATPGAAIAATNTPATLPLSGVAFRLRVDVNAGTHGIAPGDNTFKLQHAIKSAATCSVQTTGFSDVTTSTKIAFSTNASVANNADITSNTSDPVAMSLSAPQLYRSQTGTVTTPSVVYPSKKGLWDFSLKDNGATADTSYCMRVVYGSDTPLEASTNYPEVRTAEPKLEVSIVDATGTSVSSPSYTLSNGLTQSSCQTTTGVFGDSTQRIRVFNSLSSSGWSLSIAATSGATASWQRTGGGAGYDYNDPSGSPAGCNSGSDGDSIAGQLTVNPTLATVTPQSGCSTTGITKGSSSAFNQGATDAISLASASSSATLGCYWDFTATSISQNIPAFQASGVYSIDITVTAVAQ